MKGLHILTCSPLRTDAFPLPTSHSFFCVHFILLHPSPWMDHLLNHHLIFMYEWEAFHLIAWLGKRKTTKMDPPNDFEALTKAFSGLPLIFFLSFFLFNFVYFSWTLRMCLEIILRNVFRCFSIWMIKIFKH